ncbi:aldo/keto reductase [Pseudohalocynthiibacter aestuariivivens]|jgi:1-deoxyxylulose-5-phosphate synthase|uniref:Aldo/keto reductase n=1 Tax=Pseudohalocynthiibacter aestuariivivens TaxID=1591409 RepID=A0ABV5JD80_9RHOB|nr:MULTISPECIES: aldo/keto reductase [Pseudohalocynthiibacter]MBS9715969.1 aldo/keto reductase [Pseudohalocynthiibacter aestuariivivens]MCK0102474.1 aldo/keto reductase [Pseudohalocynthiibacter sp. F2068]
MKNLLTSPDGTAPSALCFGAMQFGGKASADESRGMYDACRVAEINFFDTAYVYTDGASETLLGKFAGPEREKLIIATKCAWKDGAGAANINAQFDKSRARLGMDMVDILYLHKWDGDTELAESFEALATLRDAEKIRYVGLSNFSAWQVMKAANVAAEFDLPISILQPMYNLVKRQAEVEILPMALSESIAIAPYSPLGGGLLTGKYARGEGGRLLDDSSYTKRYSPDWMHEAASALKELAAEVGQHPATLAVAWVAQNPAVTAPIISARSVEQLRPSLSAGKFEMSDALYQRMCDLSPTPPPATDRLEEA